MWCSAIFHKQRSHEWNVFMNHPTSGHKSLFIVSHIQCSFLHHFMLGVNYRKDRSLHHIWWSSRLRYLGVMLTPHCDVILTDSFIAQLSKIGHMWSPAVVKLIIIRWLSGQDHSTITILGLRITVYCLLPSWTQPGALPCINRPFAKVGYMKWTCCLNLHNAETITRFWIIFGR